MYQVKSVEGRKLNNGYEITVSGDLCRVVDGNGNEKFAGTYDQCVAWCKERGLTH
jgi:hypothetical protein